MANKAKHPVLKELHYILTSLGLDCFWIGQVLHFRFPGSFSFYACKDQVGENYWRVHVFMHPYKQLPKVWFSLPVNTGAELYLRLRKYKVFENEFSKYVCSN